MASHEVQPVTAQQLIEGDLNLLTVSKEQILNLISTTHLPDEEKIEADYSLNMKKKKTGMWYMKVHYESSIRDRSCGMVLRPPALCYG
jgi:hypothetical protein